MAAESIARIVREEWTWAGVEVESVSNDKVRCRMPAFFCDLQGFIDGIAEHDLLVDMETSCTSSVASVVFLVYPAGAASSQHVGRRGYAPCEDYGVEAARNAYAWHVWVMPALIATCQIALLYAFNRWGYEKCAGLFASAINA